MSNKKYGRVGDSPIIGAGTYANNLTCAVSATGWGEFFIRLNVAHDVHALMEYARLSVREAGDLVVLKKLPRLGGDGGIIAWIGKGILRCHSAQRECIAAISQKKEKERCSSIKIEQTIAWIKHQNEAATATRA